MPCECLKTINEQLKAKNTEVSTAFAVNPDLSEMHHVILVASNKVDSSKRGRPVQISATYCPFCGVRWRS